MSQSAPRRGCFVYKLYDADGVILYIGISVNPSGRLSTHVTNDTWGHLIQRSESERFSTIDAAAIREKQLIQTERPLHNRSHNPDYVPPKLTTVVSDQPVGIESKTPMVKPERRCEVLAQVYALARAAANRGPTPESIALQAESAKVKENLAKREQRDAKLAKVYDYLLDRAANRSADKIAVAE